MATTPQPWAGNLTYLEKGIKDTKCLSDYFSPLPRSSYHVTMYNIWCTGGGSPVRLHPAQEVKLQEHQRRWCILPNPQAERNAMYRELRRSGLFAYSPEQVDYIKQRRGGFFFNPGGCINDLLYTLDRRCIEHIPWQRTGLKIKSLRSTGGTLRLSFEPVGDGIENLNQVRALLQHFGGADSMGEYHLTLAYRYKDNPVNNRELERSQTMALERIGKTFVGKKLCLDKPDIAYFSDMTRFFPYAKSLEIVDEMDQ